MPAVYEVGWGDNRVPALSVLHNVCQNRIYEANPSLSELKNTNREIPMGTQVIIPVRPACFDDSMFYMMEYTCYPEPVDLSKDYTGHEPPISPITGTDSGYCIERDNLTTIIYNNRALTVYRMLATDTLETVAQCFGVSPERLRDANRADYPLSVRPWRSLVIPEPYDHSCRLLQVDQKTKIDLRYLWSPDPDDNRVYKVAEDDTLSSIGRRFGYLPQWIADHNQLASSDLLYIGQGLKLPPYLSLYDMAKIGAAMGGMVAIPFALRMLYRWRTGGKRKRKNEDKTKVS